jgi:hypothetical protein
MTSVKYKRSGRKGSRETSPANLLERELGKLRQELRATIRAYSARLETSLAESRAALSAYTAGEISRESLHELRDLTILTRGRKLKPERGRCKDLRKLDSLIEDLHALADPKLNR